MKFILNFLFFILFLFGNEVVFSQENHSFGFIEEYYSHFKINPRDYSFFLSGKMEKGEIKNVWKRKILFDYKKGYYTNTSYFLKNKNIYIRLLRDEEGKILYLYNHMFSDKVQKYEFIYNLSGHLNTINIFKNDLFKEKRIIKRKNGKIISIFWYNQNHLVKYFDSYYYFNDNETLILRFFANNELKEINWYKKINDITYYKKRVYKEKPVTFLSKNIKKKPIIISQIFSFRFDTWKDYKKEKISFFLNNFHVIFEHRDKNIPTVSYFDRGILLKRIIPIEAKKHLNRETIVETIQNNELLWDDFYIEEWDWLNKTYFKKKTIIGRLLREEKVTQNKAELFKKIYYYYDNHSLKSIFFYAEEKLLKRYLFPIKEKMNAVTLKSFQKEYY